MRSVNSRMSIAMHCLVFISEYGAKTKVTSTLLSLSTGCNPVMIRNILSALKKVGILSVPQGTGGARLLRSPQEISLSEVYAAVNDADPPSIFGIHANPSNLCPVGRGATLRNATDFCFRAGRILPPRYMDKKDVPNAANRTASGTGLNGFSCAPR